MPHTSLRKGSVALSLPHTTTMRRVGILIGAVLLLLLSIALSFTVGSSQISFQQVMHYMLSADGSHESFVIRELRTTRTLIGIAAGAALAVAGALMQAMTRNPLAEPGLLGVNSGASLAVVLGAMTGGFNHQGSQFGLATIGALIASVLVYSIGGGARPGGSPVRLVLAGVGFSTAAGGITSALLMMNPQAFNSFRFWDVGALTRTDVSLTLLFIPVLVGLTLAFSLSKSLTDYSLGESAAFSLGVNVGRLRGFSLLSLSLLCASATAVAGPIGFVGLMVPFFSQLLMGNHRGWIMVLCAVLGPVLMLLADITGRIIARPAEVQVGVLTAFVGAPIVIFLVYRMKGDSA